MEKINVGLIGLGTIGAGVVKALKDKRHLIRERSGIDLQLIMACDTRKNQGLKLGLSPNVFTTNFENVINNKKVDVVIELIGGLHPAKEIIIQALKNGKHVVTANKALLAHELVEILNVARKNNRQLKFEASVCGGIPIIKALREGLIANKIDSLFGIINGTSNYLLTKMRYEGLNFHEALAIAKKKGYAEKKPKFDIEGFDAAHKLIILSYLLFSKLIPFDKVLREGIADISHLDITYADEMGLVIKPLAIAKKSGEELDIRVHPTLLPKEHMLSAVNGVFNAVLFQGDMIGDMLFYGRGAGQFPTASAVISDLVDLGTSIGTNEPVEHILTPRVKKLKKTNDIISKYYLRFTALDKPGIFAKIAGVLGRHHIGIAQVSQKEYKRARFVPVVMITDKCREKDIHSALENINKLAVVKGKTVKIRMEEA